MVEVMFVPASTSGKSGMRGWLADEKFSTVAKYVQRACYLLSQGTPAAKIAIYFPTTSIWLGNNEAEESSLTIMQKLLEIQHDFDVVDEQSLQSSMKLEIIIKYHNEKQIIVFNSIVGILIHHTNGC